MSKLPPPFSGIDSIVKILLSLLTILVIGSCKDDQVYSDDDGVVLLTIDASIKTNDVDSRAVYTTAHESGNVTRYCLLIYDGMELTSTLVGAYDITQLPTQLSLPAPIGRTYRAIMLGNVTLSNLDGAVVINSSTLNDLNVPAFAIDRQYNLPKDSEVTNFTWSNSQEFKLGQTSLYFYLNPNVAKITATITNSSSNSESVITNVRIKNVANKVRYAQDAINETQQFAEPNNVPDVEYLKYDMEKLQLPKGSSQTISWYVPQNLQGVVSTSGERAAIAPANATYVEVDGVRPDFITASYKIYPGTDKTGSIAYKDLKDFNVYADNKYNLNITISNDGIYYSQDSQVTVDHAGETTKVKCFPQSNCWFVHPRIQKTNGVTVWEMPIDRINEYWRDIKNDATHSIDADSEWIMEVIWQDQNARVIHFCDEYGNYTNDGSNNTYHGFGLNPAYITLDATTLNETYSGSRNVFKDIYGNVLVGVRKPNESTYLWSWHLWVTDYCPDYAPTYTSSYGGAYKHTNTTVPGGVDYQGYVKWNNTSKAWEKTYSGCVLHLRDADYYYCTSTIWSYAGGAIWDTGIYKNKWMMDRMLGAQSPNNGRTSEAREGFGLYYQYGRKDPFSIWGASITPGSASISYDQPWYDISGNKKSGTWTVSQAKASDLSQGVLNPTIFYASSTGGLWSTNYSINPWYSPMAVAEGKKTLFDPCPPGWCLPTMEAFFPLSINNGYYTNTYSVSTDAVTYVFLGPNSTASTLPYGEFRHFVWFNYQVEEKDEPVFPIQGYISQAGTGLRLPTENGTPQHAAEIRGYMWAVNEDDAGATVYRYGFGYGTSSPKKSDTTGSLYSVDQSAYGLFTSGTSFSENSIGWKWWSIMPRGFYRTGFSHSRGNNVRCIQEPD